MINNFCIKYFVLFCCLILTVYNSYSSDIDYFFSNKTYNINHLYQTAEKYSNENKKDSALLFYSLVYNSRINKNDTATQMIICRSLNKAASIYFNYCDYKSSLELLLRALVLCEDINYKEYKIRTYNSIGNIHYAFEEWNVAKKYYKLAYDRNSNKNIFATVLNNLGAVAYIQNNVDSALFLFNESYEIKTKLKDSTIYDQLNNIGLLYQTKKNYKKALNYYLDALKKATEFGANEKLTRILYSIGDLYFETGKKDSAIYYLDQSSLVAKNNGLLDMLAMNLIYYSKIEEKNGNTKLALDYYKQYSKIKDSVFNVSKYGNINQLQFLYDFSKVNKQIEDLNNEQAVKEQTIIMQQRLQMIMGLALFIVLLFLFLLYHKNFKLNKAYDVLAKQNIEIVRSDSINKNLKTDYNNLLKERDYLLLKIEEYKTKEPLLSDNNDDQVKYRNSSLKEGIKDELEILILEVMENSEVFCDVDFSINKLAELVGSNPNYVSQIINDKFKRNFRTFINDYRIKKARKMLSDEDYQKYTIESIAAMVGFKSRNRFDAIFKEVTGITPSFYIKSLRR